MSVISFELIAGAIANGMNISTVVFIILIVAMVQVLRILIIRIEKMFDKREKIKGIVQRNDADLVIQGLLDGVMATIGMAERVQVVEFTNGNKNIALVPFNYMTCTYESYAVGKTPMAEQCKSIPTTLIGLPLQRLAQQNYLLLNVESLHPDMPQAIFDMISKRNVTKSLYVPIKSPMTKRMIGFISLDSNDIGSFSEKAMKQTTSVADQIGVLLTLGEW